MHTKRAVLSWLCFLVIPAFNTAWSSQENTRLDADAEPVNIVPQSLGIPDGCYDFSAQAMNNGTYPGNLVVAGASNCEGNKYLPYKWQNGSWQTVELPQSTEVFGGWVESVSDESAGEPVMTLGLMKNGYNTAWVKMPGQLPVEPPLLADMIYAGKMVVSARGDHIVGSNINASSRAVRWTRNGSYWLAPEDIGPGEAYATSEDGSMVVGNGDGRPWVWTAKPAGGGELVLLDSGARAYDITHNGSMIVGGLDKPCHPPAKCWIFPGPVYWVMENGQWRLHDLEALDGVDSEATDVAEVDGQPVIVGWGYSNMDGGILRPIAWLRQPDGNYGPPLRLFPLGGAFESWAQASDVNRNGEVVGWSDRSATDWTTEAVIWPLFGQPAVEINAGHTGAWYNTATPGQGQLIDVEPESQFMFLSWFTYTDATSANPNEQHWFTAQGNYTGSAAELALYETLGGQFDDPQEVITTPVGSVTLSFASCAAGTLSYTVDTSGLQGSFPISRAIPGTENVCFERSGSSPDLLDINDGWDGAWYDRNSPGQGFLIDAHPGTEGDDFMFVAWFTYGNDSASGQRWLTAQGPMQGTTAVLFVYETTGGSFDQPVTGETIPVGSMTIEFEDCSNAQLDYTLSDEGLAGSIQIERVIPGTEALCLELQAQNN